MEKTSNLKRGDVFRVDAGNAPPHLYGKYFKVIKKSSKEDIELSPPFIDEDLTTPYNPTKEELNKFYQDLKC